MLISLECDSSCLECAGSGTTCTRCASPNFAEAGKCSSTCPTSTYGNNSTCVPCPPDCATCALSSNATSPTCLSCVPTSPVLIDGVCRDHCSPTQFFDAIAKTCTTCDTSCTACVGSGASHCSSCPDDYTLQSGRCAPADCSGPFATGLGICLSALAWTPPAAWGAMAVLPAGLIGIILFLYVRRQRKKTRNATAAYGQTIDRRGMMNRLMGGDFGSFLGSNRLRTTSNDESEEVEMQDEKRRLRLRELLLPSRQRRRAQQRGQAWSAPPPPYVEAGPSTRASIASAVSVSTIDTVEIPSLVAAPGYPPLRTKVLDMGSNDLLRPEDARRVGLKPAPRPIAEAAKDSLDRNALRRTFLYAPDAVDRLSLLDAWPAMIERDKHPHPL